MAKFNRRVFEQCQAIADKYKDKLLLRIIVIGGSICLEHQIRLDEKEVLYYHHSQNGGLDYIPYEYCLVIDKEIRRGIRRINKLRKEREESYDK